MASVFQSQEQLHKLTSERNRLQRRLAQLEAMILAAIDIHKERIRQSLTSPDPEERRAAESIRRWWGV